MDHLTPKELRGVPEEAWEDLASILNQAEHGCTFPPQVAINLLVLQLKPDGSDRPITITSLIYAIWTGARGVNILKWDQ